MPYPPDETIRLIDIGLARSLFNKLDPVNSDGSPNPLYQIVDKYLDENDPDRVDEDYTRPGGYCEDYPCCGHTDQDPCPGRPEPVNEPWYCDDCGIYHIGVLTCPNS